MATPDYGLTDILQKLEKREALYQDLVNQKKDILSKRIPAPVIVSISEYKDKYLCWHNFWSHIAEESNGIQVDFKYKMMGPLKKCRVPYRFTVRDADSVFAYLKMKSKRNAFVQAFTLITSEFPCMTDWCYRYRERLSCEAGFTEKAFAIAKYFQSGAMKDCYITNWPVPGVDTKFHRKNFEIFRTIANAVLEIELANREEFYAYFSLKERLAEISVGIIGRGIDLNGGTRCSVSADEIARWEKTPEVVFIFENKDSGSQIADNIKFDFPCMVLFGSGNAILDLKHVPWLQKCKIVYSGDMDKDGFKILSELRNVFPAIKSFMMNIEDFRRFEDLAGKDRPGDVSVYDNLTSEEAECFSYITEKGLRLEQERFLDKVIGNFSMKWKRDR